MCMLKVAILKLPVQELHMVHNKPCSSRSPQLLGMHCTSWLHCIMS